MYYGNYHFDEKLNIFKDKEMSISKVKKIPIMPCLVSIELSLRNTYFFENISLGVNFCKIFCII